MSGHAPAPKLGVARARILCLHGYGTNKKIMEFQLIMMSKKCTGLDLVFVDGPTVSDPAPGIVTYFPKGPYYKFLTKAHSKGVRFTPDSYDKGLAFLKEQLQKHGPFDGILGFSQGAVVSTIAAGLSQKSEIDRLAFVINMGGVDFCLADGHPDVFDSPVAVPSMHVIGEQDGHKERSVMLTKRYLSPTVVYHTSDHRPLPPKPDECLQVLARIEAFIIKATAAASTF